MESDLNFSCEPLLPEIKTDIEGIKIKDVSTEGNQNPHCDCSGLTIGGRVLRACGVMQKLSEG